MENKEKKTISNPLTIIGLFAGLAETAGAVVLPLISESLQKYFIWYLMGFPVMLVGLFFYVLIACPKHLYAPSDYKNEDNFVLMMGKSLEAAVELTAATVLQPGFDASDPKALAGISDAVRKAVSGLQTEPRKNNRILWVDDCPENNRYERNAFENMGFEVSIALSTAQACEVLKHTKFAAIVSDMGRKEGPREGYVLLRAVREQDLDTPFFIYSGSDSPEHKEEARRNGAQGSTCYADELFSLVTNELIA